MGGCTYIAVGHENHVCNWPPGEEGPADELADQKETALLVRDGHDNANRDEKDSADAEGQQEPVPRQVHRVAIAWSVHHPSVKPGIGGALLLNHENPHGDHYREGR